MDNDNFPVLFGRLSFRILEMILIMLSPIELYELERVCRGFREILSWRDYRVQQLYRAVAERYWIPLPVPYTDRRIFSLLAGLHCELCGRPSNERGIRIYWMFGVLCCRPCFDAHTTHINDVPQEQLDQLIPVQRIYRPYRGRRFPVRPMTDRYVWTRHLEEYLPEATRQERDLRLIRLRNLESTMEQRMLLAPSFEALRQRQTLQRNLPRRSRRLERLQILGR